MNWPRKALWFAVAFTVAWAVVEAIAGNVLARYSPFQVVWTRYGVHLLGPNSLGLQRPGLHLNTSALGPLPAKGPLALVSQSGALTASMLDWARAHGVGFSSVISLGPNTAIELPQVLDFLATDGATQSILVYMEGIRQARGFRHHPADHDDQRAEDDDDDVVCAHADRQHALSRRIVHRQNHRQRRARDRRQQTKRGKRHAHALQQRANRRREEIALRETLKQCARGEQCIGENEKVAGRHRDRERQRIAGQRDRRRSQRAPAARGDVGPARDQPAQDIEREQRDGGDFRHSGERAARGADLVERDLAGAAHRGDQFQHR